MLTVLNMSLTASIVIVFVLLARLLLRKAPKVFSYALWGVVLFRLLCPISISSDLSLLGLLDRTASPVTQYTTTVEHIPQELRPAPTFPVTPILPPTNTDRPTASPDTQPTTQTPPTVSDTDTVTPIPSVATVAYVIWLTGIGGMLVYSAVSFFRLHRQLVGAVKVRDNIYLADYLDTPFVMGLFRPAIYLPSSLSEREQQYILLHEQQHIRRLDHVVKVMAFLALCIHWFNPLVWLAFVLSAKDMEMSCDEAVMRKMGEDIRTEYSASLLRLATGRRIIAGTPLAFGENSTKSRIKNVLNWKKPKAWIILTAAVLCVAVVIFCAGNPTGTDKDVDNDTAQSDDHTPNNSEDTQNSDTATLRGQYRSFEDYAVAHMGTSETIQLYVNAGDSVQVPVLEREMEDIILHGSLSGLDPNGTVESWSYYWLTKIDTTAVDPDSLLLAGSMYLDEEGYLYEGNHASNKLVYALRYADGSYDILEETAFGDGFEVQGYHNTVEYAIYDWYVTKYQLDLPLYVLDWRERLTVSDSFEAGNWPVHRFDGDGWYLYVPLDTWNWPTNAEIPCVFTSAYYTGSTLKVDYFDYTLEGLSDDHRKQDFTLIDEVNQIWSRNSGGVSTRYYCFAAQDGGCWRITIEWIDANITDYPYIAIEPQLLQLMAESFVLTVPNSDAQNNNQQPSAICTHPQFTIGLESHPLWMTTVQWFYDHNWTTTCEACGTIPQSNATWTSFAACIDGLKDGTYDVILVPYHSYHLADWDGYTVVPIQRDAIIFVRSNAEHLTGFSLTDDTIRRAFTSEETVYWDEAQTDPIIPASGWLDEQSCWPQITHLFGIEPTSSQIVFRGTRADNAPMAIADSERDGSGLWPHHFSMRNAEAALNGEPIAVNGIYPTEQTVADGSYPYGFTYYAIYSPDNVHADDIGIFTAYIQQSNCSAYSMTTYKDLSELPWRWEQSFEGVRDPIRFQRMDGTQESALVVDGNVISLFSAMATRLKQPDASQNIATRTDGVRITFDDQDEHYLTFSRTETAPCVYIQGKGFGVEESAVVYEPQLYLYLTALAEKENAQLTDLDGDGVLEAILWQYSSHDFVIYDYYDSDYHRISTNQAIGCTGSDFTGLIANVLPEYNSMVQAQREDGSVSVYRYQDGVFSYLCPIGIALGEQDTASPITYSYSSNGFLYDLGGQRAIAICDGTPISLPFEIMNKKLNHNGWEIDLVFGVATYENAVAAMSYTEDCSVHPIVGSTRFLELILDGGYTYLIDLQSGEILDPLAVLEQESAERLSFVNFSPDGQYAVISHHSGTVCVLLNCTTGEVTPLPYADDIYSIHGIFLDETHILLTSAFQVGTSNELTIHRTRYDITTGTLTEHPEDNALYLFDDSTSTLAYTYEDGFLVIVDLLNGKRTKTAFQEQQIDWIFYCPNHLAAVISDAVIYLITENGTAQAVCEVQQQQ